MIRVNLPSTDLFLDELNVLRNKRLARNIKEALNIRGYMINKLIDETRMVSCYIYQTMCEWDGEMMLFEYRSPQTKPYPADTPSEEFTKLNAEFEGYRKEVERQGDLRGGYFDSV
ncbi:MAG TPA: hypothetical protein PKM88_13295 [bacterium]|nr:hypothetical protein [bacterium]